MTATNKLQGKMIENGFTIKTLAEVVGLSATGLFNKIHNQREFVASEINAIGKALCLSDDDIRAIFFNDDVECNSTDGE